VLRINGFRRSHVIRCQEGHQQWLDEITNPGVLECLAGQMGNRKKKQTAEETFQATSVTSIEL